MIGKLRVSAVSTFILFTTLKSTEKRLWWCSLEVCAVKTTLLAADEYSWPSGGNTVKEFLLLRYFSGVSGCSTRGSYKHLHLDLWLLGAESLQCTVQMLVFL